MIAVDTLSTLGLTLLLYPSLLCSQGLWDVRRLTLCTSGTYAAAGPIAITLWRTPTKLTGDLALPLLDTLFEAICAIFITFCPIPFRKIETCCCC
jgi:hypothetical protein